MADYDFSGRTIYLKSGDSWLGSDANTGTLSDFDSVDDTFQVGENVQINGTPNPDLTFFGYLTIGGVQYPILESSTVYSVYNIELDQATFPTFSGLNTTEMNFTVCFAVGTLILTPEAERVVETLEIGDLVTTSDGRAVPVKWIGRQTVHKLFTQTERFVPVRVAAGALGDGLPHTDLVLTADHALILDGLAINAGALVNGTTIAYDPIESLPDRVTYYHVETEEHDVILANGAPAETYVDYVQRRVFDNYQEYVDRYGEERTIREMDLPRVSAARLVPPAIRARLNGEAAA